MLNHTKGSKPKKRLTGGQAAVLLLLFCVPAVLAAGVLWKCVSAVMEYYDRFSAFDSIIENAGRRNGVDPALLKAVIWRESKFDRYTIGSKGEIGLMQIMPKFAATDWAKAHSRPNPSRGALADPELNIEIGSWFLGRAIRRWKKYRECEALALCEYNAGLQRAEQWKPAEKEGSVMERITISSTASYVSDILAQRRKYSSEFLNSKGEK